MEDIVLLQEPEENYKKGYIKLYRSIEDHWISCNPYYYQAFNRLLFRVNHSKNTELIEGEIIECDRGQSLYSLNSWSNIFNKKLSKKWWTIQKVRTFFKLLQNDNMILVEGLRKTTRVTICKYESYQNQQHRDNTEITDRQHTDNTQLTTTKDIKELNNEKNYNKGSHLFKNSPYFDFEYFKQQIDEKYYKFDLKYYHDNAINYSESKGAVYKNWLAALRNWMNRDEKEGKAKMNKVNSITKLGG